MTTTLIESKQDTIQKLRDEFHAYGWRTKQVHRYADVYMVYKPNFPEHCYFVAYISSDNGQVKLLPEEPKLESYQEAKKIIKKVQT